MATERRRLKRTRARTRCPRCRGTGRSPAQHDHGWQLLEAKEGEPRELVPARSWALCTLCGGRGHLTARQVQAIFGRS